MKLKLIFTLLFLGIFFSSCRKEKEGTREGKVKFYFNNQTSNLKSANASSDIGFVRVSIESAAGVVQYESKILSLSKFGEGYLSEPIALEVGDYKLTEFAVLDSANNVLYATPVSGSSKANLVEHPLSISFIIEKDKVTNLAPEVLSVDYATPADFGYPDFSFNIKMTFLLSVFILNYDSNKFEMTSSNLTISAGTNIIYTKSLSASTNQIPVNEGEINYILKLEKTGYVTYIDTFTQAELKAASNRPLKIILQPVISGLVAYYPFNGNANDESGNGNNGTDHGPSNYASGLIGLCRDFANTTSTTSNFDYTTIPNTINPTEFTISYWINFKMTGSHEFIIYLGGDKWAFANFWMDLGPNNLLGEVVNGLDMRAKNYSHDSLAKGINNPVYLNSSLFQANKYYFITCKLQLNVLTIYINGNKDVEYINLTKNVGTSTANILIGVCPKEGTGSYYYPLAGSIDELKIFNRALSDNDIQLLYKESKN